LSKLFPVIEVGSLNKAPFRVRDTERAAAEAERWGVMLGVERFEELVGKIKSKTLSEDETLDWACIYGLKFFEKAGLDIIYDGEQRRVEMYEHPLQYIDGFEFRGVVRVWDNEYYRKAAVVRKPSLKTVYHVDELLFNKKHTSKPLKVPVTSAYTLADWSFDEYYIARAEGLDLVEKLSRARYEFVHDLTKEIIRPVVSELASKGADYVQLDEPAAATKPHEAELVVESINETVRGIGSKVAVHICYTDYAALFPDILELKADVLSISCSNADTTALGVEPSKRPGFRVLEVFRDYDVKFAIAPGLIDVHTDFIEPAELVRDRLLYACRVLGKPDKIYGCNDCGLRTRKWDVAYLKQLNLVKGCEMARKVFEG
jgi:5-methyltetrahydropteroyltriglutamate--homocysteine methyltransferase